MKLVLLGLVLLMMHVASGAELTEIMYNPAGSDTGREWVELFTLEPINSSALSFFNEAGNHKVVRIQGNELMQGYIVISNDADVFLSEHSFSGNLVQASFSLKNTGEAIGIKIDNNIVDGYTYSNASANGNGKSLEKSGSQWDESKETDGTPGYGITQVPEFSVIGSLLALLLGIGIFAYSKK